MKLDIARVLDLPGEKADLAGTLDLSWIKRLGQSLFPESLAVRGQIENRSGVVSLRYQISGEMQYSCERCLMQNRLPLQKTYAHTVVRSLEDETLDDVFLIVPDGILDVDSVAADDLLLEVPQVLLCKPDCKGLCPVCGQDLNRADCGCSRSSGDPRLAILKTLLENQ